MFLFIGVSFQVMAVMAVVAEVVRRSLSMDVIHILRCVCVSVRKKSLSECLCDWVNIICNMKRIECST